MFKQSHMIYRDYKWNARADGDNPKVIKGTDYNELDRTQGYEMIYFINSLAKTWGWVNPSFASYQHLEKIIREEVPSNTRTHGGIKDWISSHYQNI